MPFVTEEIWSFHPARRGHLVVHPFPEADESLFDDAAEADVEGGIGLTQRLRAWRDLVDVPVASVLLARIDGVDAAGVRQPPLPLRVRRATARRAGRLDRPGAGCSPPRSSTPTRSRSGWTSAARSCAPRSSAAERKLGNEGFVAKAPPRSSRRSAASSSATAPNSRSCSDIDPEAYLDSLEPIGWRLGLERMHRLTTALGMPQHRFASIHVVGTNGKSSVTRMIAALLEAHGLSAGACVSPHAARWSERVLIHGEEIGAAEFAAAVERVAQAADVVNRVGGEPERSNRNAGTRAKPLVPSPSSRPRPPPPSSPWRRPGCRWRRSRRGSAGGSMRPTRSPRGSRC